jgi:hypothetical protein
MLPSNRVSELPQCKYLAVYTYSRCLQSPIDPVDGVKDLWYGKTFPNARAHVHRWNVIYQYNENRTLHRKNGWLWLHRSDNPSSRCRGCQHCFVFEISTLLTEVNFILEYTRMIDSFAAKKNDNRNELNRKGESRTNQLRGIKVQKCKCKDHVSVLN